MGKPKQQRQAEQRLTGFADAFLANGRNATLAARAVGYKGNDNVLAARGSKMLAHPSVQARLAEHARAAGADSVEVTRTLVEQMRGSFADFLSLGDAGALELDLALAKERGKLHLVKRVHQRRTTRTDMEGVTTTTVDTDLELHDPQRAARHVGELLGMFVKRTEDLTTRGDRRQARLERVAELLRQLGIEPLATLSKLFPGIPRKQIEAKVLASKSTKETEP